MLSELQFGGKAVVVTGAGSGIGRASAEALAELGAVVFAIDSDVSALDALAQDMKATGRRCVAIAADVTCEDAAQSVARRLLNDGYSLKALVNNVGTNAIGPLASVTIEDWNRILNVNLTSGFLWCRTLLPQLQDASGGGAIVNVSSSYGLIGGPGMPAYCASKAGVIGFTRQLALDHAAHGLRANVVCPGMTATPRVQRYVDEGRVSPAAVTGRTVGRRLAQPREVGNVIAFLASDAASYVNGAVVPVDGGLTAN